MITLDEARARGIALPLDDAVAQDIIDEQEAWLTSRIGLLEGERTETFFVGIPGTGGKLALRRPTDAVDVVDNGNAVDDALIRILDNGSSFELKVTSSVYPWWLGPYVAVTYTPNDATRVRSALFDLLAISLQPASTLVSETIGAYSYTGGAIGAPAQARAIIVSSLKPRRDGLAAVSMAPPLPYADGLINRRELPL